MKILRGNFFLAATAAVMLAGAALHAGEASAADYGRKRIEAVAQKTGTGIRNGAEWARAGIRKGAAKAGAGLNKGARRAAGGSRKAVRKTGEAFAKAGARLQAAAG